jgi:hypothetical protein
MEFSIWPDHFSAIIKKIGLAAHRSIANIPRHQANDAIA